MPANHFHHLPLATLDTLLALQITVAWAGEQGDSKKERMGWWETMLLDAKAGVDVFRTIAPRTKLWLCCKAVREVARRTEETLRKKSSEPEKVYSLFHLGDGIDFLLAERFDALIHQQADLHDLLRYARFFEASIEDQPWEPKGFAAWLSSWGTTHFKEESVGRALSGPDRQLAQDPLARAQKFLCALHPLSPNYPFPHLRSHQ